MNYIIAASTSWHRPLFQKAKPTLEGNWHFVESPDALTESINELKDLDYIFFMHWSWRVPEDITNRFECICFHMTDLPYGRGGSPLQNLILNGHKKTKISAIRMTEEVDAGPIYVKKKLSLKGSAEDI